MHLQRTWLALSGALLAALLLVGCGDSSGGDGDADLSFPTLASSGSTNATIDTAAAAATTTATAVITPTSAGAAEETPTTAEQPSETATFGPAIRTATEPVATTPTSNVTATPAADVSTATSDPINAATPTTPAAATAEATSTPAEPTPPPDRELLAALPKLEDMPTGWTVLVDDEDDAAEEDDSDESVFCGRTDTGPGELFTDGSVRRAEVEYSGGEFGPFLFMIAARADGEDERMQAAIDLIASAIICDGWTDPDGTEWTGGEMAFPTLGDDTYAYSYTADAIFPVTLHLVLVRDADTAIIALSASILDAPDAELTEQLVRDTLDRLN